MGTAFVIAVLLCTVFLIVRNIVKKKLRGESSCGCNCSGCSGCCGCSTQNRK